jgi:cytochrome P450
MKTIPSIQGHPLWGFAREFRRDPLHLAAHLAQQHGGIVQLRVLHRPLIAISDPAIARHILHRNPENYPRSFQYRNGTATLGEGLLTVEGDSWHRARRMMQPAFRSDPVRDIAGVTVGCWNDVERDLLQTIARGQKVDMAAECLRLAMDIILRALCGMQLPAPRVRLFGDLVTDALFRIRVRNTTVFPAPLWIPTPNNVALHRIRRALDAFLGPIVEERLRHPEGSDMLSALARARDESGVPFTHQELLDQTKTLFAAGFETSATAMAWAMCELADNPHLADQLAAEANLALNGQDIDRSTLDRLPLAGRFVDEVLRLHPPVYNLGRFCLQDEEVGGWRIPAGVNVLISIWAMHRGPHWGDSALQFQPDRWLPDAAPPKEAYMPFAAGRHTCIGNHFALVEMRMMVALICRRFRLAWADGCHRPGVWPRITAAPDGPVWLRLESRS